MAKIEEDFSTSKVPRSVQPLLTPDLEQRPAESGFRVLCPACFSRVAFRRARGELCDTAGENVAV